MCINEKELGFIVFKELFNNGIIENKILSSLLENKFLTQLEHVEQLLFDFSLNVNNKTEDIDFEGEYGDDEY